MKKKAVFNWSGGKDSALALKTALESGLYDIISLLTTTEESTGESVSHKIPAYLIKEQAASIGIPEYLIEVKKDGYSEAMEKAVKHFGSLGAASFIFGDIHLHDIKKYRDDKLNPMGIEVVEPLWEMSPEEAMRSFLSSGIKTTVVAVTKPELIPFLGKEIDKTFIESYPKYFDICGENGEYHTFCHDGPIFKKPVTFSLGEIKEETYEVRLDTGATEIFTQWNIILE